MNILVSKKFLKEAMTLPIDIKQKLDRLIRVMAGDIFNPRLHTKQLRGSFKETYSFRITRDWRGLFEFLDDDTIQLTTVGHRKDVYR